MPIIYQKRIYREDLQANPHVWYVFGDNRERVGLGGQAGEMRGEPNAIGVATKASPSKFWSDINYQANLTVLHADLYPVYQALLRGETVVLPLDGFGTGLSEMPTRCPETFKALQEVLSALKGKD